MHTGGACGMSPSAVGVISGMLLGIDSKLAEF